MIEIFPGTVPFNLKSLAIHSRSSKVFPSPRPSIPIKTDTHVKVAHCAFMQINCRLFPLRKPPFRPTVSFGCLCCRVSCSGPGSERDSNGSSGTRPRPGPRTNPAQTHAELPSPDCFIKLFGCKPGHCCWCRIRSCCCCCDLCKLICL